MMGEIRDLHSANREKVEFSVYALAVAISSLGVADMLARGWVSGHISKVVFKRTPQFYLDLNFPAVTAILFGFYIGLLLLLVVDVKKRWQGILLSAGTIIGIVFLRSQNLFIFNIFSTIHWLLLGTIIGIMIGGGSRLTKIQSPQPLEFRRSARIMLALLILISIGGWVEYHISYPSIFFVENSQIYLDNEIVPEFNFRTRNLWIDTISMGIFVGAVYKFVKYDAERSFLILGPSHSGKTLFVLGAYIDALEDSFDEDKRSETPMMPTNDLMEMIDLLDRQGKPWIVSPTEPGEVNELAFRYVQGSIFPLNVYIRCLDYAGEYLHDLPDYISGFADYEDHANPAIIQTLVEEIERADTLILLIDVERYLDDSQSLEMASYFDIIKAVSRDKEIIISATKCDYFADRFRDERGLEPYRYFDDFTAFVNQELIQSEQIRALVRETAGSTIHPVYYQTTVDDQTGQRVPMRDESGSVMVVGFDELREKLA